MKIYLYILLFISPAVFGQRRHTLKVQYPSTTFTAGYYFSASGSDFNAGTSPSSPFQSITKLNSLTLVPGDHIFFKKGDSFYGTITQSYSGSSGNPIVYDAYGTGTSPKITGLASIASWTSEGGGVYSTAITASTVNMVTINDTVKAMGRYPNTGWINYESHSGNTSITDNELTGSWVGSEIVIKKARWILDRHIVTSQSTTTLTYNALNTYGTNSSYLPVSGNGYFIQGSAATLDRFGEWYFASNKLYVYFGAASPTAYTVKASALDKNFSASTKNYVTFNNINFEGGNTQGCYFINCSNITFNTCTWTYQGGNGIYGGDLSLATVTGGSFTNCLNDGIWVEYGGSEITVDGASLNKTGMIAGAGRSGDGAQESIFIIGNGTTVKNCTVKNSGYNAVAFKGNDVLVEKNFIDSFCVVKDDGGGVYTYTGGSGGATNRIVRYNTITNSIGSYAGAEAYSYEAFGKSCGIYLDDKTENVELSYNNIANGEWGGIFIHNSSNIQVLHNTVYNHQYALFLEQSDSSNLIRNVTRYGNKLVAKTSTQIAYYSHTYVNESAALTGLSDSNYYARPIDDNLSIYINTEGYAGGVYKTLATWQSTYSKDAHGHKSANTVASTADLRFDYNETSANKLVTLAAGTWADVDGTTYSGTITLSPYTSLALTKL